MIPTLLRRSLSGILALVLSATAASPHHSFSAVYDDTRAVTVSGVVTDVAHGQERHRRERHQQQPQRSERHHKQRDVRGEERQDPDEQLPRPEVRGRQEAALLERGVELLQRLAVILLGGKLNNSDR